MRHVFKDPVVVMALWFEEVSLDVEGQVAPLLEASAMADADGRV